MVGTGIDALVWLFGGWPSSYSSHRQFSGGRPGRHHVGHAPSVDLDVGVHPVVCVYPARVQPRPPLAVTRPKKSPFSDWESLSV